MAFRTSVIIPCHNAAHWIGAALCSVSQQKLPPHEIVVIDDSSTDDSVAQIHKSGVPVKLLQVNFCNAAATRNAGISAATGDWIALLDADDIWYPNHLARAAELLVDGKDVGFMANHDWIDVNGELLPMPDGFQCKLPDPRSGLDVEEFYRIGQRGFHFGHSTVVYRADRVRQVGMFDPSQKRRHDIDLWLRMIAGRTWTYDTIKSAAYRETTPGSISKDEMECDYYYLRALIKNLDLVQTPLHREHLARQSRRAMGIAFVSGPADQYVRIRELAWPYLSPFFRFFYRLGSIWPEPLRGLIKLKRYVTRVTRKIARPASHG